VDVVDEEPDLLEVGRRFFGLDRVEFAGICFHGQTAERFLEKGVSEAYDFIFDDLFDGFQHVPAAGRGLQHIRLLRAALSNGGIGIKNLIWTPLKADTRAACMESREAFNAVFGTAITVALGDVSAGHNRILIGSASPDEFDWPTIHARLRESGLPDDLAVQVIAD
jgi:hypothetical protein